MKIIERIRIGSHWEERGMRGGRKHREIVDDYTTVLSDCLPGKTWLEAHYQDVYPEPSIDIIVDGGVMASINGNYKRGVIKKALEPYTTKAKVGRRTVILAVGEADRVAPSH